MPQAMEETKTALAELLESARAGTLIPIRLPGQIEAIQTLLLQTEKEQAEAIAELKNAPGGDVGALALENAEFLRTAIHELRTPMTSIRGYTDMLNNEGMAGSLTDMQKQLLSVVRVNARRMEGLLTDLSYLNKLRGGLLKPTKTMDLFKNIVLRLEQATRPLAEELRRQVEFDIPSGLPLLNTDGELLALALVKLVENGLRYSPEGTGKVTVRGSRQGENTLAVTIADNGCGMTEAEIAALGTLFFRSENEVVRAHRGSGLGIPIAYGLIALLGGRHAVTSAPGQGTTFTVVLGGIT